MPATVAIGPQEGPQTDFLSTSADIAVYGGAAGGGKSYALLMEPLRHVKNPGFGGVIFRRTSPQITNEGGLWDTSMSLYPHAGAVPSIGSLDWRFPSGANIGFRHLQHAKSVLDWQGSQVPYIGFDELTHFTEHQFFYMLSRNRSACGVKPYVRAGTNPDADSWVRRWLAPWLDREHELKARSGEIRWMIRVNGAIKWFRTKDDVPEEQREDAKSVTFVKSTVYDNQILLKANPEYLANLKALPPVDRARLLDGDWDIVAEGNCFQRVNFRYWVPAQAHGFIRLILDDGRSQVVRLDQCRLVQTGDLAASEKKSADYTVFAVWAITPTSELILLDLIRGQWSQPTAILQARNLFTQWRPSYCLFETNGLGLPIVQNMRRGTVDDDGTRQPGLPVRAISQNVDKVTRSGTAQVRIEAHTVFFPAEAEWLIPFERECLVFPSSSDEAHDDQVDNLSLAAEDVFWQGGAPIPEEEILAIEAAEKEAAKEQHMDRDAAHWWQDHDD
jgi:predicted phage terminase large subunit-like protein